MISHDLDFLYRDEEGFYRFDLSNLDVDENIDEETINKLENTQYYWSSLKFGLETTEFTEEITMVGNNKAW